MIIIGITGAIGHGKSTLADFFAQAEPSSIHLESSQLIAEVANDLNQHYKDCLPQAHDLVSTNLWLSHLPTAIAKATHFHMSQTPTLTNELVAQDTSSFAKLWEYLELCKQNPNLPGQTITTTNKSDYRTLLQWLGSYGEQHIKSGLWYGELVERANNSGKSLAIIGGVRFIADAKTIQSAGGVVVSIERPDTAERDLSDPTESERKNIATNTKLLNNGTLEQLYKTAKTILQDIQTDNLHPSYNANKL